MITKWIEFSVDDESAEAFAGELSKMQGASRAEDGCLGYSVFQSREEETIFMVLESWQSSEHFEAHRKSAHMVAFKARCSAMIVEKSATTLREIP